MEVPATYNVPKGTIYITVQQMTTYTTFFIYYVLLIRILDLSEIGEISLLTASLSIFTTITLLALPSAATRFISASIGALDKPRATAVARKAMLLLLSLASPAFLLAALASPWIGTVVF